MSGEILSNADIAQQHATAIASAVSLITSTPITKDEISIISGNDTVSALIDHQVNALTTIQSQMTQLLANIHGIANEFEVQDQQLTGNFKPSYLSGQGENK